MTMLLLVLACSGTDDGGFVPSTSESDSGTPPLPTRVVLAPTLGSVATLSDPPSGGYHHHATVALGSDSYVVAWTSGHEPQTHAWAQQFSLDGAASGAPQQLSDAHLAGQKPDVAAVGATWLTAYDDRQGGVWLRELGAGPSSLLYAAEDPVQADAVDLAVQPDGAGIAIWTEFGEPGMAPDDGRIVWRAFDAGRQPVGAPQLAESSSKKASDAATRPDGGFAAVWAIHRDHPTVPDEVVYEVRGSILGVDEPRQFRADDLVDAWPSRPAIAVDASGRMAVSWRDKTSSRGEPAGAYGRLFDAGGEPLGPSVALVPGGSGDRVVAAWAGEYAIFAWQEDSEVWLAALDLDGAIVLDPLQVSESGSTSNERPSIDLREVHGGYEVVVIWETVIPGTTNGDGLRARVVTLEPRQSPG